MPERKAAIINVSKGFLGISVAVLTAMGGATGNIYLAGAAAIPGAIMASGLLDLLGNHKEECVELPIPRWWTEGTQAWQEVCTSIEGTLHSVIEEVPQYLQKKKLAPTPQNVHLAFYEEMLRHIPPYVSVQDRALLANHVTPLLLKESALVLRDSVAPLREAALAEVLSHTAALLDAAHAVQPPVLVSKQTVDGTAIVKDVIADLEQKRRRNLYDVYISYADADEAEVMKIGEQLKEKGILPWFDAIDVNPGLLARPQQEEQIRKIPAATVFIGQQAVVRGQALQMYSFIEQFVQRGCRVIPVTLPNVIGEPELPIYLANFVGVDFRRQVPDPLIRLIQGITGKR